MTDLDAITDISLTHRVVMLAMAELNLHGETPAYSFEIRETSRDYLMAIDADVVGDLSESTIMRSLNELVASDLLSEKIIEESSVGKGRQSYDLAVPADSLLDSLAEDDHLAPLVGEVRDA